MLPGRWQARFGLRGRGLSDASCHIGLLLATLANAGCGGEQSAGENGGGNLSCPWLVGPAAWPQRVLADAVALALLYLEPVSAAIGVAAFVAAVLVHLVFRRTGAAASLGARAG